jgi:enamine deaminase RidA (YjgF/YER057c/UK114 family)
LAAVRRLVIQTYREAFNEARTIVPIGALHYGALVEISAIAEIANRFE